MTIIPVASMALVIRNIDYIYTHVTDRRYISFLLICLALVIFAGKIEAVKDYKNIWTSYNDEKTIVDFLREHNLTSGYAGFWEANEMTVVSDSEIKIRAITNKNHLFSKYEWFAKDDWYTEEAHFIIYKKTEPEDEERTFDYTKNVMLHFGEPDETYNVNSYIIWVYRKDISKVLGEKVNVSDDGVITPYEMYHNKNVEIKEIATLKDGGIIYGPYEHVDGGEYKITYVGKGLNRVSADIWSTSDFEKSSDKDIEYESRLNYEEVSHSDNEIVINFKADDEMADVEYRANNDGAGDACLEKILIEKMPD